MRAPVGRASDEEARNDPDRRRAPAEMMHLLNPVAAEALKTLEERPTSARDLAHDLASALGNEMDDDFPRQVSEMIARFDDLGLTEPVEE